MKPTLLYYNHVSDDDLKQNLKTMSNDLFTFTEYSNSTYVASDSTLVIWHQNDVIKKVENAEISKLPFNHSLYIFFSSDGLKLHPKKITQLANGKECHYYIFGITKRYSNGNFLTTEEWSNLFDWSYKLLGKMPIYNWSISDVISEMPLRIKVLLSEPVNSYLLSLQVLCLGYIYSHYLDINCLNIKSVEGRTELYKVLHDVKALIRKMPIECLDQSLHYKQLTEEIDYWNPVLSSKQKAGLILELSERNISEINWLDFNNAPTIPEVLIMYEKTINIIGP